MLTKLVKIRFWLKKPSLSLRPYYFRNTLFFVNISIRCSQTRTLSFRWISNSTMLYIDYVFSYLFIPLCVTQFWKINIVGWCWASCHCWCIPWHPTSKVESYELCIVLFKVFPQLWNYRYNTSLLQIDKDPFFYVTYLIFIEDTFIVFNRSTTYLHLKIFWKRS